MAIVEMKKLSLLAMRGDQEVLLRLMQKMGCIQVEELDEENWSPFVRQAAAEQRAVEQQARVRWAISELSRYGGTVKKNLIASLRGKPVLSADKCQDILWRERALMEVVEAAELNERKSGEARTALARAQAAQEQLTPWQGLRTPLEQVGVTKYTTCELITMPAKEIEALRVEVSKQNLPLAVDLVSQSANNAYLLAVYHNSAAREAAELLREHDAAPVAFPQMRGTVQQQLDDLLAQMRETDKTRDALREELTRLSVHVPDLKILYDLLEARAAREAVSQKFAGTESTFFAQGWVPAVQAETIEQVLMKAAPCAVESRAPLEEEKPPTLLKNGRVVGNFEGIVQNFSLPDPRGLDPTFIMTPFFACFFGMMVSDAGYGVVLALLLPILCFVIKPKRGEKKMLWVLGIGGLFTIFWGTLFNTWFGANPMPVLLDPLMQPLEMMALCLGVGAIHLFTGLGIAAYMNIRRGKPWDALFDQGFWAMMLLGLGMLALPATSAIGKWMAIIGAAGIILFAGRDKKNIFSRLMGGFGSLYNITGWLSDLLSYARLFGMGLATGVIGMVFNMLAGMIMTGPVGTVIGVLFLIVGHAFNMGINTLGAYVHSCRLQYIEFFGKFYEDGGRPFTPLTNETRYVDLSEVE